MCNCHFLLNLRLLAGCSDDERELLEKALFLVAPQVVEQVAVEELSLNDGNWNCRLQIILVLQRGICGVGKELTAVLQGISEDDEELVVLVMHSKFGGLRKSRRNRDYKGFCDISGRTFLHFN